MKPQEALKKLTAHVRKTKGSGEALSFYVDYIQPIKEYFGGDTEFEKLDLPDVSKSLRDKLEDFVAKYWYDNEYQHIDKQDHEKATESREKFRKWFDDNIGAFLKQ